ncbi:MAG: type IV toxin-antitoxin system AbiEi family antitoxin domain-containing protein, partial [Tannerella sp.]|nr:type IV toxin-antitoxin system AbiEi family antitoxin domain-containing protein [Tannerella sp.]
MESFKSDIHQQIDKISEGRIFTFADLVFPLAKFANVAVILSNLTKAGKLVRIEKGAYYKPKPSTLG